MYVHVCACVLLLRVRLGLETENTKKANIKCANTSSTRYLLQPRTPSSPSPSDLRTPFVVRSTRYLATEAHLSPCCLRTVFFYGVLVARVYGPTQFVDGDMVCAWFNAVRPPVGGRRRPQLEGEIKIGS